MYQNVTSKFEFCNIKEKDVLDVRYIILVVHQFSTKVTKLGNLDD